MKSQYSVLAENLEADFVVIGGGGAGLAAAVTAAEKGARVVVLEKRNILGGNSRMADGPMAVESPAQRRQAIPINKDDIFKRIMDWSHWKTNPRIIRAILNKSAETIQWFEDRGAYFKCISHSVMDMPLTWHVSEGHGAELVKILAENCNSMGVRIFIRTTAQKILTKKDGSVSGVLVTGANKKYKINVKNVLIATGGFIGNKKLMKKYCPNYRADFKYDGLPHAGDGFTMANEIGAATEGIVSLLKAGPIPYPTTFYLGKGPNRFPISLWALCSEPMMIWINNKGKRFIDESIILSTRFYVSANALDLQPDGLAYFLFDSNMINIIKEKGLSNVQGANPFREFQRSKLPPGLEKEIQIEAKKGENIKISTLLDEIADWIGVDRKSLRFTIDEYNSFCDKGYDPIFAKNRDYLIPLNTPPYYAVRGSGHILNTIGGIKINEHMEVLDKKDNPIPGLYAAGVDTGGWISDTYCVTVPGTAFSFALNSGRIAAENAVKRCDI